MFFIPELLILVPEIQVPVCEKGMDMGVIGCEIRRGKICIHHPESQHEKKEKECNTKWSFQLTLSHSSKINRKDIILEIRMCQSFVPYKSRECLYKIVIVIVLVLVLVMVMVMMVVIAFVFPPIYAPPFLSF